jgi:heme exporter protein C
MWQWFWQWMHKLGSPKIFFGLSERWWPWLVGLTLITFIPGTIWALLFVPEDYQQGDTVRIMYMHVPASILAQSSYMMMATAAAVFLIWRIKLADVAAQCIAPIGASFTFLALATGAIWGKPMWGTWWVWDARLTSTLVLFFLFVGIMALRAAIENRDTAGRAAGILAVVGVVNIPIIKWSVDWWYTLHQPASITLTEKPAMPADMWMPLLVMVIGFYGFFLTVLTLRMQGEILNREFRADWVKARVNGALGNAPGTVG